MAHSRRSHARSRSEDWDRLGDEEVDPNERINALHRLRRDGHLDRLMPLAEDWLRHTTSLLRAEAISILLFWGRSARHVPQVFAVLHHDPVWWLRSTSARLLTDRRIFTEDTRDEILRHLVAQLEVDEDEDAQMGIYGALLRALIPHRADRPKLPGDAREWDRGRDVDWRLLAPWRTPPA